MEKLTGISSDGQTALLPQGADKGAVLLSHLEPVILASASPRRSELLEKAGIRFSVVTADTEETTLETEPEEVVKALSGKKADGTWKLLMERQEVNEMVKAVIGADTVVALDGKILGKPKDEEDAVHTLLMLQGREHQVYTGVTIFFRKENGMDPAPGWERLSFAERTDVWFYPVEEDRIRRYVETGEPMDKAGSYAIQGAFMAYVQKICGDYCNVVGLPVSRMVYEAKLHGIDLEGV